MKSAVERVEVVSRAHASRTKRRYFRICRFKSVRDVTVCIVEQLFPLDASACYSRTSQLFSSLTANAFYFIPHCVLLLHALVAPMETDRENAKDLDQCFAGSE